MVVWKAEQMVDLMVASMAAPMVVHSADRWAGGSAEKKVDQRAANLAALMADLRAAG